MEYTDERPLIRIYGNLLEGSKNYFRAYVKIIEKSIGYGNYKAQYLTQEEVDEILGRWNFLQFYSSSSRDKSQDNKRIYKEREYWYEKIYQEDSHCFGVNY